MSFQKRERDEVEKVFIWLAVKGEDNRSSTGWERSVKFDFDLGLLRAVSGGDRASSVRHPLPVANLDRTLATNSIKLRY